MQNILRHRKSKWTVTPVIVCVSANSLLKATVQLMGPDANVMGHDGNVGYN